MYRPRSISRLVLLGIAVVLTPLLAAVITAVVQVDRLAQRNRITVLEARLATEQSRALVGELTAMQRALGQYRVRGDRDFYGIYLERRGIFRSALGNLAGLDLRTDGAELAEIDEREQALFDDLGGFEGVLQPGVSWEEVTADLEGLDGIARRVLAAGSQLIESQADDAIESAEEVQRILLSLSAAAIVMTTLLAALFFVTINRPMSELGDAIRRLGARDFGEPISVRGPRDVEALGEQLDWLRRRIVELETQKTTFLQHISHELKTPLTTIREGAELLAESLDDDEAREEAEISQIMRTSSLYLQRLIEDLLQFARTQDPAIDLELRDGIDLGQLIQSLMSAQAVAVGAKHIVVEQDLEAVRVRGDEKKLQIILDNLLTNAIKYTPDGGLIRVSLRACDPYAFVDVLDSGPGIDPAEAQIIFEPFQQGAAEHQSSVKGTGLGLSIAREYVEAHDGFIKVIPSDRGAHFQVALPVAGPAGLAPA